MVACSGKESENDNDTATRGVSAVASVDAANSGSNTTTPGGSNTATLEWDAVTAANFRGYRIYYGPEPDMYLQFRGDGIDVGNVTTYTVRGLASRSRYYFAVTAYDSSSNESDFSQQVYKDIP